jgi:Predicted membrane protein (DUF2232)
MSAGGLPDTAQGGALQRVGFGPLGSGLVSLLLYSSLFVLPFLGIVVAPFGVIPVLHLAARRRSGVTAWGWVAVLLAGAAVAGGGVAAVVFLCGYLLLIAVPSLSVDLRVRSQWTDGRWVAVTTVAASLLALCVVAALSWPKAPVAATSEWLRATGQQAIELYRKAGVASGNLELALDASERVLAWVLPSLPVAYLVAVLFWLRPRLPVLGFEIEAVHFEEYRGDEWLPVLFAVAGLGVLVLGGTPRWAAINLLAVTLILYFVHGLAIIRAHLVRFVGRGWLVRWGVALLCLQVPLPIFVAGLGIVDSFHSLRPRPPADDRRPE